MDDDLFMDLTIDSFSGGGIENNIIQNNRIYKSIKNSNKIGKGGNNDDDRCECHPSVGNADVCLSKPMIGAISELVKQKDPTVKVENLKPIEVIEKAEEITGCDTQSCLLSKPPVVNELVKIIESKTREDGNKLIEYEKDTRFKRHGPSDNTALLSNFDIDGYLEDLRKAFPKFHHIKFQMIDFANTNSELDNLDIKRDVIDQDKNTVGVVINTDDSKGRGKHWFCLFMDFRNTDWSIEFFNSSGNSPVFEIQIFLAKILMKAKNQFKNKRIILKDKPKIRHQQGRTECGVYSLYYITKRLEGIPHEYFLTNTIRDNEMTEFRKKLFRKYA